MEPADEKATPTEEPSTTAPPVEPEAPPTAPEAAATTEEPATPTTEEERPPQAAEPTAPVAPEVPGFVKVTVAESGCVGMWTTKPESLVHLHSDETIRPAKVTVTGQTAGFAFGARGAEGAPTWELFAEDSQGIIKAGDKKVASFTEDGGLTVPGNMHAEAFNVASSRAFKTDIVELDAFAANKVRGRGGDRMPPPAADQQPSTCPRAAPGWSRIRTIPVQAQQ